MTDADALARVVRAVVPSEGRYLMRDERAEGIRELIEFAQGKATEARTRQQQRIEGASVWRQGDEKSHRDAHAMAEQMAGREIDYKGPSERERLAVIDDRIAAKYADEAIKFELIAESLTLLRGSSEPATPGQGAQAVEQAERKKVITAINRWYEAKRTDDAESAIHLFEIYIHEAFDAYASALLAEKNRELDSLRDLNARLQMKMSRIIYTVAAAAQQEG